MSSLTDIEDLVNEDDFPFVEVESIDGNQTLDMNFRREFHSNLIAWYHANRRKMPWRGDPPENRAITAYGVWVSEIMLQQTRVETVISYWNRWMDKLPDVAALAVASSDEVNTLWAGLGYYRRAQNLRLGAQYVMEHFNGVVPNNKTDLLRIPGIGPYTAGAIASIAFNQSEAAVDGNVYRVFSRVFTIDFPLASKALDKMCWSMGEQLVGLGQSGTFNQALMELGATICKPLNPQCSSCPVQQYCKAAVHEDGPARFPVKAEKKTKVRDVSLAVHVLRTPRLITPKLEDGLVDLTADDDKDKDNVDFMYLLWRRPAKGLLANQWEFPSLAFDPAADPPETEELRRLISDRCGLSWSMPSSASGAIAVHCQQQHRVKDPITHIFSHEKHSMVVTVEDVSLSGITDYLSQTADFQWMTAEQMEAAGITTGCKKILKAVQVTGVRPRKRVIGDVFAVMKGAAQQSSSRAGKKRQPKGT